MKLSGVIRPFIYKGVMWEREIKRDILCQIMCKNGSALRGTLLHLILRYIDATGVLFSRTREMEIDRYRLLRA